MAKYSRSVYRHIGNNSHVRRTRTSARQKIDKSLKNAFACVGRVSYTGGNVEFLCYAASSGALAQCTDLSLRGAILDSVGITLVRPLKYFSSAMSSSDRGFSRVHGGRPVGDSRLVARARPNVAHFFMLCPSSDRAPCPLYS